MICNHKWIWKQIGFGYSATVKIVCEKCGQPKYRMTRFCIK